jgi:uncharacterized protein (DUF1697 family)
LAIVVFLRGVNVGGYRTFRPAALATALGRFDVVNIGAAGTFVIRARVGRATLRAELMRRLPFATHVMMCEGRDILRFASSDPFADQPSGRNIVRFVSVLARRRPPLSPVPLRFPARARWCLRIAGYRGRFVFGVYRREMKAISYLGQLDKLFGVAATTRNWNTILAIVRILESVRR